MTFKQHLFSHFLVLVGALASAGTAYAQLLPSTELKVVGGRSTRASYQEVEKPFWVKSLPERSEGRVVGSIKGYDELGLKGPELIKLIRQGIIEFGVVPLSYAAAETPLFEAVDIAGLVPNIATARQVVESLTPALSQGMSTQQQIKILGISPYGPQVLFCQTPIASLSDLKGKVVRTITRTQAELIEALGAKSVTMTFGEVLPAFKKNTINCAVAGAYSGFDAQWYSAATHIFALPLGWNYEVHAVSQKVWDQLAAPVQSFLLSNIDVLLQSLWTYADQQYAQALACSAGARTCAQAPRGQMVVVQPSPADLATMRRLAIQTAQEKWATRCTGSCVSEFNATAGKALRIVLKQP
jgi:TRAP-type C4-dicarboxylate transport system substrate-binding protein